MRKTLGIVSEDYVSGGSCVVVNQIARLMQEWDIVLFINEAYDDRNLVKGLDRERIRIVRYRWKTLADLGAVPVQLMKRGHVGLAWLVRCLNLVVRYPHIFLSVLYLSRCFKKYGIDFVISSNGGYPGGEMCRAAVLGAALRRIKALMIVHNMPTSPPALLRPMEKVLDRLVGRCTSIVCVSKPVAEALTQCRYLGIRPDVIENAVDRPPVQPTDRPHLAVTDILCVGSISPLKDQIKALTVYRILVKRLTVSRPNIAIPSLTIMGPVADQDYFSKLTHSLNGGKVEGEHVVLLGYCDPQIYFARSGQLLLISSNREGLPLVLLEAMSHGVPAVSTDAGGIGDVITQGVNGEIRAVDDIEGLVDSLWRYVTDPVAYSNASRRCIETFNMRYSAENWVEKYRDLIANISGISKLA